ncbi:MAG: rod shape-determining protein MreC [Candidatus Firestonebacteria bacterium]
MWRKFFLKYRIYIILICLLLVFTLILYYSAGKEQHSFGQTSLISEIIYPWQKLTLKLSQKVSYALQSFVYFFNIKKDNERLNKELSMLIYQNNELMEIVKENERLKSLLNYKKKINFKSKIAMIVGRDVNNYFGVIYIDIGEKDGIKKDMPVITYNGVVGKVVNVLPETSSVLLITDYNSSLSGAVQRTRCIGSVKGQGSRICEMKYLSINDDVKVGDLVITSGEGKFPKGLVIGEITNVSESLDSMSLNIVIKPAINVLKLEEVLVVVKE